MLWTIGVAHQLFTRRRVRSLVALISQTLTHTHTHPDIHNILAISC